MIKNITQKMDNINRIKFLYNHNKLNKKNMYLIKYFNFDFK